MADVDDGKCVCGDYQAVHIMNRCWGPKCAALAISKVCTGFVSPTVVVGSSIPEIETILPFEPHKSLIDEMFESAKANALKNPCICFVKPSTDCPNPLHRENARRRN